MPKRIERKADARNVGVHRPRDGWIDQLAIGELPQRPETGDIGLGFLDGAVELLHLLPHGGRAAADGDVVRTEAVHQLVHEDVREERVEDDVLLVGWRRARPC